MTWGVEARARLEMPRSVNFAAGQNQWFVLNRVRVWAGIEGSGWVRFYVQGQDRRAAGVADRDELESVRHSADFARRTSSWGRAKGAWGGEGWTAGTGGWRRTAGECR